MLTHLVLDGVADGALGVALDIVGAAERLVRARVVPAPRRAPRQRVVSIDGRPVRTASGRRFAVDGALSARALGAGDVLAVPGLSAATPDAISALLRRPDVVRGAAALARAAESGALVAASCSATFVLGASGVLDGGQATTTWWLAPTFRACFPDVELRADRMVVASGRALTAGSALAHADLVLAIVARRWSPSLAEMVARYLVLDERSSQARYMVLQHLRGVDPAVRALERFVLANVHRHVTIDDMARATASSARTLARRTAEALGTTPQRFAQRLRVERAVHLLETTRQSVEEVSASVGYADPAAFRRVFRRETGRSPRELRRQRDS